MDYSGYAYVCSAGESFDIVALRLYGDEKHAAELMQANPEQVQKCIFIGGEMLRLPVVEVEEETDEQAYTPANAPWRN